MQSTCSEEQCARPADARGFCKTHYKAWVKAGRPDDGRWDKPCAYCGATMKDPRRTQCGAPECARLHTNAVAKAQRESRKARGLPEIRTAYNHTCNGCGKAFTTREKHANHCSIQCFNKNKPIEDYLKAAAARQQPIYPYECKVCGRQGIGHFNRTVCDDNMCQYLGTNGRVSCPWYYKTCAWCDQPFTTEYGTKKHCTTKCSNASKLVARGYDPREYRRHANLVYQRDNYTCHLCGKHTLKAWDENNRDESPSLDHIIPKSQGGPDTPDNLACAHWLCNTLRSVTDVDTYRQSLLATA